MNIAVITGASSGMGRDFVYAIDKEYDLDEIWVIARRKERLDELKEKCRNRIVSIPLDLQGTFSYSKYKEMLEQTAPHIKVLVNAAGFGLFGEFEKLPLSEQLDSIDLNAKALTAFCYLSLPYMTKGDSIINLGSNSAWQPVPYQNVYSSTKHYVLAFSRGLGKELEKANRGIHVMCVCPGWIKTEFMERAVRDNTISYFDRWYTSEEVVERAMKDLKKKKKVSILGLPVRNQVRLVKFLPVEFVMNTWCKQQGKK